jgi:hypothetical protein
MAAQTTTGAIAAMRVPRRVTLWLSTVGWDRLRL